MKLQELLKEILLDKPQVDDFFGLDGLTIYGKNKLEPYKDKILQCEEFSECEELHFMDYPFLLQNDDRPIKADAYKLNEGQRFRGVCYLLSLSLTPEVFDPNTIHTPVKDGACITPILYNPETFTPLKKIVLEYNVEKSQDGFVDGEYEVKMEMKNLLEKVLDNPKEYLVKGERGVIVRGVFERNEVVRQVTPPLYLTGTISYVSEDEMPGVAYYLDSETTNVGEVNVKVKTKVIPPHLKNLFKETLQSKGLEITEEEINKFLEDNQ